MLSSGLASNKTVSSAAPRLSTITMPRLLDTYRDFRPVKREAEEE
jgi:hypothetical protein